MLIGNNATILDFAEIGEHCIVAANSVVATGQEIPSNSFVIGVPAEVKQYSYEMKKTFQRMAERYFQIRIKEMPEISYLELMGKYKEQGL